MLRERLGDAALTSSWLAHDDVLERRVHLHAVGPSHPHAEAVLDAARRAAAVEDARLVRVLDVGQDDDLTYVVSEWLPAPSLAEQLQNGPLSPAEARTVVGEAALALEAARHRGLHHLRLTPERVHLLDDGTVKVTALATAAALDGIEVGDDPGSALDGEEATRLDTRDLIALAYATLTGTWPLSTPSDLPAAPHVGGKPVAPSQIVTGAPADLDTLCAQTFAGAGAPDTPGDLAGQIAPWGRQRREERGGGAFPHALAPTQRAALPTAPPATPAAPARTQPTPPLAPAPAAAAPPPDPAVTARPAVPAALGADFGTTTAGPPTTPLLGLDVIYDDLEDDAAGRRHQGGDQPRSQTRTVLLLVAVFVVVFLTLAYCGLRGLGKSAFVPAPGKTKASAAPSATASSSEATSAAPSSETPAGPLAVASASGFDPQGDGAEKNDLAPRAIDGNESTSWTSDTYKSAQFGGLKKGVGLLLDLGRSQQVTSVSVRVGAGGGTFELRTADGDQLGSRVLAQVSDAAGTITLTPSSPVTAERLVLWCTQAPQVAGGYRVEVAEVVVK